jgi:hypothetical protein
MPQSSPPVDAPACPLQYLAGLTGSCPDERCPFCEPAGAPPAGGCSAAAYALVDHRTLAEWLPKARRQVAAATTPRQREEVRHLYHRLLSQAAHAEARTP